MKKNLFRVSVAAFGATLAVPAALAGNLSETGFALKTLGSISLAHVNSVRVIDTHTMTSGNTRCSLSSAGNRITLSGNYAVPHFPEDQGSGIVALIFEEKEDGTLVEESRANLICGTTDGSLLTSAGVQSALQNLFEVEVLEEGDPDPKKETKELPQFDLGVEEKTEEVKVLEEAPPIEEAPVVVETPNTEDVDVLEEFEKVLSGEDLAPVPLDESFVSDQRTKDAIAYLLDQGYSGEEAMALSSGLVNSSTWRAE